MSGRSSLDFNTALNSEGENEKLTEFNKFNDFFISHISREPIPKKEKNKIVLVEPIEKDSFFDKRHNKIIFDRNKVAVKWENQRSYINSNYLMTPGTGVIGIYGIDDSRFIYIELDCLSKRTFELYQIHFYENYFNGLSKNNLGIWMKTTLIQPMIVPDQGIFTRLKQIKDNSNFQKEFQATREDIKRFTEIILANELNILVNNKDIFINNALKDIYQDEICIKNYFNCTLL